MVSKLDKAIEYAKSEIAYYSDPGGYLDKEYYIRCAAKVDAFEEMLSFLENLKKEA